MENSYRLVTECLHFSKWIVANSKNEALEKANIFWNNDTIISLNSSVICYQHLIDEGTGHKSENIEWLVQAKVECRKADQSKITRRGTNNSWEKEEDI